MNVHDARRDLAPFAVRQRVERDLLQQSEMSQRRDGKKIALSGCHRL
jgi:hypothetical protein